MSLMAELGEGPPPAKPEQAAPGNQSNFGRPLLANPPPNPMVKFFFFSHEMWISFAYQFVLFYQNDFTLGSS